MLVTGLVVLPGVAFAQQYFDPGLLQKSIDQKPQDFQALGARLGSFMFTPGVELIYEHNDNVFYLEENEIDDSIFHIRPWANLVSDWNRHAFNVTAWADIANYSDFGSEDYEDWALSLDGRVDVRRDSYLSYEGSTMRLHEDRRSPDDVGGVKPTDFDYSGLGIGYDHTFNRLEAGMYFRKNVIDYDNNIDGDGNLIDNRDRNRDQDTLTLRVDYQLQPQRSLFASYAANAVFLRNPCLQ